ncbi:hypothetical protein DPEC_G00157560 [Dallia pectoralis]|uniref:Uncharacterized protein n=1 Tax=Dallia pectoralis TaxID=75939 RepID=A0ACC2GL49_DALPE|nr:hypothetical protein DPEC_G00157560 [Dallia pectoralis]
MASAEARHDTTALHGHKALEHILASEGRGPEEGVSEGKDARSTTGARRWPVSAEKRPRTLRTRGRRQSPGHGAGETYLSKNGKIAVVRAAREEALSGTPPDDRLNPDTPGPSASSGSARARTTRASKRKCVRCVPSREDRPRHTVCGRCNKYICKDCSRAYCTACPAGDRQRAG